MKRILFVDNDSSVIEELKKMLYPMCDVWETKFAVSGEEALNFMAESPFDVVVSDMHMPEMNGVELLDAVMEHYPETVRIIHSRLSDKEMALRSVKSAHQFLMKPCSAETMKFTIERTCKLRDLLRNEALKKIVTGIKDLPSYPTLYGLIVREMQSKEASLKKVGYIISQDVSMSAKILQVVNSAFFGLPQKIADPQQAAVYLGIDTLKALVLSVDVFSSFTEDAESCGFSLAEMTRHSLMTGRLAKDIARAITTDGKVAEEAMIAGILHDIGKLILLKVPRQYKQVDDFVKQNECSRVDAEYAVMKTSHAELGAYLLGLWGIPDNVVEAIAFHHNPSKLLEDIFIMQGKSSDKGIELEAVKKHLTGFAIVTAVHVANALMMQESSSSGATTFPYIDIRYLGKLNVTDKLPKWADNCNKIKQEAC
jgi:putative nucleotidyltransferase with HDIG domain